MNTDNDGHSGAKRGISRRGVLLAPLVALAGRAGWAQAAQGPTYRETPYFARAVASGKLPPVAARLPQEPAVAHPTSIGKPGGTLQLLMGRPKDTKMMVVYGYARLVAYTPKLELQPDILKSVDIEQDRVFTLHLRQGMKWSDGHPFTAEDFRFWFEDVASNRQLSPSGLPVELLPHGTPPSFKVVDETTVRYSWERPNPLFLPNLAGADPLYIYCPAHYLKKYHIKYANKKKLAALVSEAGRRNWAALFTKKSHMYRNQNPKLPTLEPWVLKTKPPSQRLIFVRNPYYYRVDGSGQQLPYIDRVVLSVADGRIIPAKTGAGESDLQARYLAFANYTFLKAGEKHNDYTVRLWRTGPGSQLALYPNLNVDDPIWRGLVRDVRFRRALSLAVNRHEINEVIYFGLALEGQNTLLPQSPLFKPQYRDSWAHYDLTEANQLLDRIGLKRGGGGIRRLPDGRPADLIVEGAGDSSEEADVLELIRDSWRHIGIRLFTRPMQLTLFRRRVFSGQTVMSISKGIENGLATAAMPPWEFAPTSQQQLEWPKWGQYRETKGMAGEPPALPAAIKLKDLYDKWLDADRREAQRQIWQEMLEIWSREVYSIGTVAGVPQPVVVDDRLHNVPEHGIYNWAPGAFFGMYKPDTFWFGPPIRPLRSAKAAAQL